MLHPLLVFLLPGTAKRLSQEVIVFGRTGMADRKYSLPQLSVELGSLTLCHGYSQGRIPASVRGHPITRRLLHPRRSVVGAARQIDQASPPQDRGPAGAKMIGKRAFPVFGTAMRPPCQQLLFHRLLRDLVLQCGEREFRLDNSFYPDNVLHQVTGGIPFHPIIQN